MVETVPKDVALLSIHPRFAMAFLRGTKSVEFRKKVFARKVGLVVLYATAPIKQIVGYFSVGGIDQAKPSVIWERHGLRGGITEEEFIRYYNGSANAIAIAVKTAMAFKKPIPLEGMLGSGRVAPQSFVYLRREALRKSIATNLGDESIKRTYPTWSGLIQVLEF